MPRKRVDILSKWIGSYFVVEFLDHTENQSTPATIRVIGKLIRVESNFICIRAWEVIPEADPDCQTEWAIVRSTIEYICRLERVDG